MSLSEIRRVFENITTCNAWSLQLLQIRKSRRDGTNYCGRGIILSPEEVLDDFLTEIHDKYCSPETGLEKMFTRVVDYDGTTVANVVYKLDTNSEMVLSEYQALVKAIGNPDSEINPLAFPAQAYVLRGSIFSGEDEKNVTLISMQNPITQLKHKFLQANGVFTEISDKVISLRTTIDVVIIDNSIYMLTLAGENLFNMERTYKSVCINHINSITALNIINDALNFKKVASQGHNPRKFISFNESHLNELRRLETRIQIGKKFDIPLSNNQFDVSKQENAEKLIKLLCDRGMIDPFDDNPMEVLSSRKWNK